MKMLWIYMLCSWFSLDSHGPPPCWHWCLESMDCRSAATLNRSSASRFWCVWKSLGRVSMHAAHPCAHQPPRTMNFEFPAAIYSKIHMKSMKSAEIRWCNRLTTTSPDQACIQCVANMLQNAYGIKEIRGNHMDPWHASEIRTKYVSLGGPPVHKIAPTPLVGKPLLKKYS